MTPHTVLYAEDSEDDAFLMQRAFRKLTAPYVLTVVTDGRRCMQYLTGGGEYSDRIRYPLPAFLLLDMKMPYATGLDVLRWKRDQPALAALPSVMLTSSSQPSDIEASFAAGASAYLVKPSNLDRFREMVEDLCAAAADTANPARWQTIRGGARRGSLAT